MCHGVIVMGRRRYHYQTSMWAMQPADEASSAGSGVGAELSVGDMGS